MSYTPTQWSTGDTITASSMNKIEQGIANAGGALICNSSYDQISGKYVLDKTVQEIYDALLSGTPAYIKFQYGTMADFAGTLYLAPIVKIFNYDTTSVIRIVALKPSGAGTKGTYIHAFTPFTLIYSATGVNEYPAFYTSIGVSVENSNTETGSVY